MPKAGKNTVRVDFGKPKRNGTVTIKFRITNDAGGNKFDIKASFPVRAGDTAEEKAKKAKDAIQTEIDKLAAANRGADVAQAKASFPGGKEILLPTIFVRNKQGFGISKFDYDNGKTKEKARAKVIDTSEPEENAADNARSEQSAVRFYGETGKGTASVQVGDHPEVQIQTGGMSLAQVHGELADKLQEVGVAVSLGEGSLAEAGEGDRNGPELRFEDIAKDGISADAGDDGLGFHIVHMGPAESG